MQCHAPPTKEACDKIKKHIRDYIPIGVNDKAKIQVKFFVDGQTFEHMLGYVQKVCVLLCVDTPRRRVSTRHTLIATLY